MLFSKTSQLLARHAKKLKIKKIFFAGNIQDLYPIELSNIHTKIYIQQYHHWLNFQNTKNKNIIDIHNNFLATPNMINHCNTLIYYWPKNKSEALFQLMNLLSNFFINSEIFIIGKNNSGIKSAPEILYPWVKLIKLDQAKHSILYTGILINKPKFILNNFFKINTWNGLSTQSLPGVFGFKKIDPGSKLLASTFSNNIKGKVLDLGCGSGFLSVVLAKISPKVFLTLTDTNTLAIVSSKKTLDYNKIKGTILLSNIYSNIYTKFNMIVSNPPIHEDLSMNFNIIKKVIENSIHYLKKNGELRLVTNYCFNCENILKKHFKTFNILKIKKNYRIYQAFLK